MKNRLPLNQRDYFKLALRITVEFCLIFCFVSDAFSTIYSVGIDKYYKNLAEVPFDSLNPGDTVNIFYRERPYYEKIILRRSGTKKNPITIRGIPQRGKLPIIDGISAVQFQKENRPEPGGGRWLVKVGDGVPGNYIHIKNLHLRNANNTHAYKYQEKAYMYNDNAAGVFIRIGRHVVVSGCIIQSCGNGILTGYGPAVSHFILNRCKIFKNGNHKKSLSSQEHNVYLQGAYTTVQFCVFGEQVSDGQNVKDRSLRTVIRYNWIEGGKSRQLDLVDYKGYRKSDAFVYGNVIIQGKKINNKNMVHWGGDQGHSRSGTLFFFNNTVIGKAKRTLFIATQYANCQVIIILPIDLADPSFLTLAHLWL